MVSINEKVSNLDDTLSDLTSIIKLNDQKAGLPTDQIRKNFIEKIINEVTKGSPFREQEKIFNKKQREKIKTLKNKKKGLSLALRKNSLRKANEIIKKYEAKNDPTRLWLHIDMDMFFCSVAEKLGPSLKGKPFVIGRSIVASSSYSARKYGIRSGIPVFIAKKLYEELQTFDGVGEPEELIALGENWPQQKIESEKVQKIMRGYGKAFLSLGDDELSIDATDAFNEFLKSWNSLNKNNILTPIFFDFKKPIEAEQNTADRDQLGKSFAVDEYRKRGENKRTLETNDTLAFQKTKSAKKERMSKSFNFNFSLFRNTFWSLSSIKNCFDKKIMPLFWPFGEGSKNNPIALDEAQSPPETKINNSPSKNKTNENYKFSIYEKIPVYQTDILEEFIKKIKKEVFEATSLTASIGAAFNPLLAKVAADYRKPDGFYIVKDKDQFLENLTVRKVPGIGKATETKLIKLGMATVGEMWKRRDELYYLFKGVERVSLILKAAGLSECNKYPEGFRFYGGFSSSPTLNNCLFYKKSIPSFLVKKNIDQKPQNPLRPLEERKVGCSEIRVKSIGRSITFRKTNSWEILRSIMSNLCASVFKEMKRRGVGFFRIDIGLQTEKLIMLKKGERYMYLVNNEEDLFEKADKILLKLFLDKDTKVVNTDNNGVRYVNIRIKDFRRTDFSKKQAKIVEYSQFLP